MLRALSLLILFAPAALADTCAPYPWTYDARFEAPVAALEKILTIAPSLAQPLDETRPVLCLGTQPSEAHGSYAPDSATISLVAGMSAGETTAILIHELRHLDQNWRGICLSPDLTMRDHARAVFALEADAMAITTLIAWKLREIDQGAAFDALQALPGSADIAAAFAASMSETHDDIRATADAFATWYASDTRREQYYISTCEAYLREREDTKRPAGALSFQPGTLTTICKLPNGSAYPCLEPEQALPR